MTALPPELEGERGRYECPACPRRFEELAEKKRHIRDEHGRRKP